MQQYFPSSDNKITKLIILETGTYNKQWGRPYETMVTGTSMDILKDRLSGGGPVAPSLMGGIAHNFIMPQAAPEKQINIIGGWDERRCRFMLEVMNRSPLGIVTKEMILGYTDHRGIGMNGAIDPNMQFYINSIVQVRETNVATPLGMQQYTTISDNSHILVENNFAGCFTAAPDFRMRPTDLYTVMTRTHLKELGNDLLDTRSMIGTQPQKSRRTNSVASNYSASLLDHYQTAADGSQFTDDIETILSSARGKSSELPTAQDPFMRAMGNIRGTAIQSIFTFKNLIDMDPDVVRDEVTLVMIHGDAQKDQPHRAGDTQNWDGANRLTQVATILGQSVPALLMEQGLTVMGMTATNRTMNGQMEFSAWNVEGFSNVNLTPYIERFRQDLEHNIMNDISYNNTHDYAVEMLIDLLGETRIKLSLNGCNPEPFVVPSFCDAMFSPIVTNNGDRALSVASEFQSIFSEALPNGHNNGGGNIDVANHSMYGTI